ncbi:hypothetical protein MKK50_08715 [Methylobacterium sp. J-043]|uniref:hypothetical protein n=1 Tax=Methylorubrum TaxID=2282523 RepID=UPI00209D2814|nr:MULTISPECIES: hypothetical protein [Methylorubrum]MCJ2029480.1 hypothetical protein [Methylobacterium sp. J-043]MCP1551441.1 UPF0716 family protein affecting phage T7 exclusion [Methylorubrum zatmanii]MCP1556378.1 UPF0716 family protein affecting phage T7 exclusion [Methylorubrum extorquens]MCP1581961.1 UPF0716 family protein affecting phage T7 exclusion [Methylorubrum extorquens]
MNYKDIQYRVLASATILTMSAMSALGQSTGDPSAPLDILKTARQKAQSSQLNATSIAQGGNNAGIVFTILFAVVGIALAGISGVKLYKSSQDDNAREDAGRSLVGLVVGSAITILGVIIGVVTTYMTGNA